MVTVKQSFVCGIFWFNWSGKKLHQAGCKIIFFNRLWKSYLQCIL
jgi:hypothetical protein